MGKRATWLSVTPEPERELPEAVATLALGRPSEAGGGEAGGAEADGAEADGQRWAAVVAAERERIERLVLRGTQRQWLAYLHGVVELIEGAADSDDPTVARARERAAAVISNHHHLLLAMPGRGADQTAADRERLAATNDKGPA
jgi:hypothetical protein